MNKLFENIQQDSGWLEKAQWRKENDYWLDASFRISVKILRAFRTNVALNNDLPKNKEDLALLMNYSMIAMNKILSGKENLNLEVICKIQLIMNIKLI